ncbi:hypothetical protein BFS06_12235 [Clostridium perfringens]|uniref:Uncharacterized protein n=1 Tax=Clostridium perfringens TaxID=1502 RepID=A0A140GR14_CLOPF|nr:hypothetical protein [Clostridium perfringens]AMN30973.1 hypothetical protein JFP838_pA0057 [Clostridium perfringens]TBX14969.1 hypothetical protein BFS06_12235 [Clostridium perfringens]
MNKKGFLKELILGLIIAIVVSGGILYIETNDISSKLSVILSMIAIISVRLNISFIMSKLKKSC